MKRALLAFVLTLAGLAAAFGQQPPFPASLPPNTVVGNVSPVSAPASAVAISRLITASLFTAIAPGLVPGSGGGVTAFLRADGTWAVPAGGGAPGGANTQIQVNNVGAFGGNAGLTYNLTTNLLSGTSSVWNATNPNVNNTAGDLAGFRLNTTYDIGMLAISNPNFSNATGLEIVQNSNVGQNVFGGGTNAKKTLAPLSITHNSPAAGQRFIEILQGNYYGMGDAFLASHQVNYAGGPGAGDEGQGINAVSFLKQPDAIVTFTISALPTKSTLNTTTTQIITGSQNVQTVTVTSSVGANVGDWVIVDQAVNSGTDNIEAVQITAVGAGTISGRFINNHSNGVTITPALLITPSSTASLGEQRLLVNTSTATAYSTGTITATSGANLTGSGTAWTAAIVGGTATNIGAIALASDDQTAAPFNGTTNRLKAWYPITSVASGTSLNVHSYSVTGDLSYKGKGVAGGPTAYIIRPSARIMMIVGNLIVAETSAHTWTVGDVIEASICPWPDVTGFQWHFGAYTPGGTFRAFMDIQNTGFRKFAYGISIGGGTAGTGGADANAFGSALHAYNSDYGLEVNENTLAAIRITDANNVNGGKIVWGSSGLYLSTSYNFTTHVGGLSAFLVGETSTGLANGTLSTESYLSPTVTDGGARLHWPGTVSLGRIISDANYTFTTSQPIIDLAQTWNAGAIAFTGIKFNATDTASAVGSLLMDLQVGGVSKFNVTKAGAITGLNFTSAAQGLVPASGGGTTNFLRADGTWAAAGGGTPAGVATEIQYRNAGAFGAVPGSSVSANGSLGLGGATVTASDPVLNVTQTWNNGAVVFTGIKSNITNTASGAGSLLMDLQVGGTSQFNVSAAGGLTGNFLINGNPVFGVTNSVLAVGSVPTNATVFIGNDATGGNAAVVESVGYHGWSSTTNAFSGSYDLRMYRVTTGVVGLGTTTLAPTAFIQWGGQARVTTDFAVSNSVALTNVTGLTVNVAAGRTYTFETELYVTDAAAGGVQAAIAGTATATAIQYTGYTIADNAIKAKTNATALATAVGSTTTTETAGIVVRITGTITVNAGGTLTVQMAQNTSNATATTAKRGSWLIVQDMP